MKRISLKDLKLALDKIPLKELEDCYITHQYTSDDPVGNDRLTIIKYADDYEKFFEKYDTKVIQEFAESVFEDAKKIMTVIINPDLVENYQDDECE